MWMNSYRIKIAAAITSFLIISNSCGYLHPETKPGMERSEYVRGPESAKMIVFIHGLFGDGKSTWRNDHSKTYWPDMIVKDQDFNGYDVYVVNYVTPFISRTSTIEEVATQTLQQLEDEDIFRRYKQIYFITHSMGGLIAKRILVKLNRPATTEQLQRVKAVLYFSAPAQGAEIAEIGQWISLNPQLKDMRPADLNSFLQSLENDWQNLLGDRDRNEPNERFPKSFCAYETQSTLGIMIVNRVYAATRCDINPYPIPLNHIEIVKPSSQQDDPYRWSKARILETASSVPEIDDKNGYIIKGQVIDQFKNEYVRNASVKLKQAQQHMFCCTGDDGEFIISNVPKPSQLYYTIAAYVNETEVYTGTVTFEGPEIIIRKNIIIIRKL